MKTSPQDLLLLIKNLFNRFGFGIWLFFAFALLWFANTPVVVGQQVFLSLVVLSILLFIMKKMNNLEYQEKKFIKFIRIFAIMLAVFLSFRYFSWRINYTIVYYDPFSFVAAILLISAEIYGFGIYLLGAFVNSYPVKRKPESLPADISKLPTVDILIPSYNEEPKLLELTLLAATQIRYPAEKLNVYLCDDGGTLQRRNRTDISKQSWDRYYELKEICKNTGAIYVTREKNEHAKAGNLNAALKDHARGDLVVIFDADHIPTMDFLENTVGFFLKDPKLFLVQTPHYFINPDPLERNLKTYKQMPSENEMFYTVIQYGLDFWNSSFFCGSAAVLRREHLNLIGGISGETITEDAETAMTLHGKYGLNSIYYGKPMVAGLQPETFSGFIVQRSRWAQGMVQIFMLKNPWIQPALRIPQKIAYTSSVFFWFFPFARIIFFLAPAMYLLFSLKIVVAFVPMDLLAYALPHVIGAIALSNILYGRTRWPLISELYETIQSVHALPAMINVIKNPRSPAFAVTPKGERLEDNFISQLSLPFYLMLIIDIVSLTAGVVRFFVVPEDLGIIIITMVLTFFNMLFSLAALGVMLEKSQKRNAYRMSAEPVNFDASLQSKSGETTHIHVNDLSHTGLGADCGKILSKSGNYNLLIKIPALNNKIYEIPVVIARRMHKDNDSWNYGLEFSINSIQEERLIVALVYGDSDFHEFNQRKRQHRIGILEGLGFLFKKAFVHGVGNIIFLSRMYFSKGYSFFLSRF
ncbi:MAG: UDP-forming cellulose synthase catalytic subunit [Bacteroidales bacterium]|nr:UDP-forming cellulose synthase catalytic subunit [Bacteroidales bacterium]